MFAPLGIGSGETLFVLLGALFWDRLLGEPPAAMHPVVWMGKVIALLDRWAPRGAPGGELRWGLALALLVPALFATGTYLVLLGLADTPWLRALTSVWLLKSSFALRGLGDAGEVVARALAAGDLSAARLGLRSLCSRDASVLDAEQVAASAVESLAENSSDSVVAPLFFFALFGLPGALAYRAINTADAMIGYRGPYEHLGKAAARLDDLANLIPARLCAVLLLVAGTVDGLDGTRGWRILVRDGGKTASPNAGRPMAAMAGLLGVRLTKPGHYALGDPLTLPGPETIARTFKVVRKAAYLAFFLTGAWLVGR
jgi:adenosylcobinamide-phosphate synthase